MVLHHVATCRYGNGSHVIDIIGIQFLRFGCKSDLDVDVTSCLPRGRLEGEPPNLDGGPRFAAKRTRLVLLAFHLRGALRCVSWTRQRERERAAENV